MKIMIIIIIIIILKTNPDIPLYFWSNGPDSVRVLPDPSPDLLDFERWTRIHQHLPGGKKNIHRLDVLQPVIFRQGNCTIAWVTPPENYCDHGPWKLMVGRWILLWDVLFSGDVLVLGRAFFTSSRGHIPVVPGQAGGGSFQKEKNYIAQKEFAYRMCARRPTSAMPKSFLCCERAFCRSMVVMFCALKWSVLMSWCLLRGQVMW